MKKTARNTSGLKHEPKLNPEAVARIREDYAYRSRTTNLRTLAEEYGVSINTIHSVVLNKTWKCEYYAKRAAEHPIHDKHLMDAHFRMEQQVYAALNSHPNPA